MQLVHVAERILEMTGSSAKITYADALSFMTELGLPDLRRAKDELGWLPIVTLDQGLEKTLEFTKAQKALVRA